MPDPESPLTAESEALLAKTGCADHRAAGQQEAP